jgi:alcohol dehydrogenase class IV
MAISAARESEIDLIVGFGGSTATDTAKLVALGLARSVTTEEELGRHQLGHGSQEQRSESDGALIPQVAVPTTLSAGEFTSTAGATDTALGVKQPYREPGLTPRVVFLDPELTVATPPQLWGTTGVRALHHAIATVCSPALQPFAESLAVGAISILGKSLVPGTADEADVDNRGRCQVAAWMSVTSMTTVPFGLSHALGYQLGARFGIPHGVTSCICLPAMLRYNRPVEADRQAVVAAALGVDTNSLTLDESAAAGEQCLREIIASLGVPTRLRDWGVAEEDLPLLAAGVTNRTNSRPIDEPGIYQLYRDVY